MMNMIMMMLFNKFYMIVILIMITVIIMITMIMIIIKEDHIKVSQKNNQIKEQE